MPPVSKRFINSLPLAGIPPRQHLAGLGLQRRLVNVNRLYILQLVLLDVLLILRDEVHLGGMRRLGTRISGLLAGGEEDGDGRPAPGGGELGMRREADGVRLGSGGDVARCHLPGVRMRLGGIC